MLGVRSTESGIRAVTVDGPSGPGVRLRIASAGICGTDVSFAAMGLRGFTYGHEMAGTTPDGRAWAVEPSLYCGSCAECASGDVQRCDAEGHGVLGIFRDGGMTSEIVVPEFTLLPLPDGHPRCPSTTPHRTAVPRFRGRTRTATCWAPTTGP
jgi:threonine dehydrogenase-like Zn-dependent dehydrogenase